MNFVTFTITLIVIEKAHCIDFFFLLIMYDIYQIVKMFTYILSFKSPYFLGYLGDFFYHGAIPPPYCTPFHYINLFLIQFCDNSIAFVVFFSCICALIENILLEIGEKVHRFNKECAFQLFSKAINFIHKLNKDLHSLLLILITGILLSAFLHAYALLFIVDQESSLAIHRILNIIISFFSFAFLYVVSSSEKDTTGEIRQKI